MQQKLLVLMCRVCEFAGLDSRNGLLDWTTGVEYWSASGVRVTILRVLGTKTILLLSISQDGALPKYIDTLFTLGH